MQTISSLSVYPSESSNACIAELGVSTRREESPSCRAAYHLVKAQAVKSTALRIKRARKRGLMIKYVFTLFFLNYFSFLKIKAVFTFGTFAMTTCC